jgi:lysosomal acid lipase/cholesteryl ester hydrolase
MDWIAGTFCHEGSLQGICANIIFVICGFDEAQVNTTLLETIMHHTPAGASTNSFVHFAQEINSKKFRAFDYGKDENNAIYGSDTPPDYDLKMVTAPVAVYWAENDWLAHPTDVLRLFSELPNIVANYDVPYPAWNHLDFVYGIDANIYVYPEVLANMERHRHK